MNLLVIGNCRVYCVLTQLFLSSLFHGDLSVSFRMIGFDQGSTGEYHRNCYIPEPIELCSVTQLQNSSGIASSSTSGRTRPSSIVDFLKEGRKPNNLFQIQQVYWKYCLYTGLNYFFETYLAHLMPEFWFDKENRVFPPIFHK